MPLFGELFVSEILNKPVLDPKGDELGRVSDVSIVRGKTLPKVDFLVLKRGKEKFKVGWTDMNMFTKRIMAANITSGSMAPYDMEADDLLIVRDVLDKQIVDANGAKVVRANDIKLEGYESDAVLVAVDVGMRGILRRLGFERGGEDIFRLFRAHLPFNLISWNYIQPLQPKLSTIALTVPRQMMSELHPADLAELISQVSHDEGAQFFENLDVETAAETLSELEPDSQTAIIADMDSKRASDIIGQMPPDEAADVLAGLPAEKAKEILENIEEEEAEDIQELLGHEEDTAGGLMTNEFVSYPSGTTVGEVLGRFGKDAEGIEAVYYVYVVDEEKLAGVVSLRELLLMPAEKTLSEIMETKLKTLAPGDDEMDVAALISKYNLVAVPVVDEEGFMMGIVTVDDIVDRILPPRAKRKRRKI